MTTRLSAPEYAPARGAPSPSSTKGRLLTLLKRRGGQTVDELSGALALASMTVRQHLATLERDELVQVQELRTGPGRPRHIYRLTEQGEEAFPKRYDRLAAALLRELGELEAEDLAGKTPMEKQELVLCRLAAREADHILPRLTGRPLATRVAAVAEALTAAGGLAEWERTAHGFEIRDYNCVYRRVAAQPSAACTWHLALLARVLGAPVTHGGEPPVRGGTCCRFLVADSPPTVHDETTNPRG
jgi:predicted ArsR family transcriptional regulator